MVNREEWEFNSEIAVNRYHVNLDIRNWISDICIQELAEPRILRRVMLTGNYWVGFFLVWEIVSNLTFV